MSFIQYLKRGAKYVLHGVPEVKVYAKVSYLAPNEMLKGRIAMITGGTSGIGLEIAKAYVRAGAQVLITGRNEEKLNRACKMIFPDDNVQNRVWGIVMDNTNIKEMPSKMARIKEMLSGRNIDILVNNAGVVGGEVKDCTEEKYDVIMDTNLKGTFFLSQYVARNFVENKIEGNILMIGSSSSLRPATSAYTISKNALFGFTKGLAKVLVPHGITVNGLAPGPTATPMLMPNGVRDEISFHNPLGRYVMPGEIANMAVFLVSDMGRSIIGDTVFMTGGSGIVTYDDVQYNF